MPLVVAPASGYQSVRGYPWEVEMHAETIRFDDGAGYERYMGVWSRLVGERFLDWLAPASDGRWLDVGCGNGAFTELIVARCRPAAVLGIDPSAQQLAYARARPALSEQRFLSGDAMALPCADASFDLAVMPLVLFFVPDPALGIAEMRRVVRAGGTVAAYAWDMHGGGFPYHALQAELRAQGVAFPVPPSLEASRGEVMQALWAAAGLRRVETCTIEVRRRFESFEDFWAAALAAPSVGPVLAAMPRAQLTMLRAWLRAGMAECADGAIVQTARANAVSGQVPDP